MTKQEQKNFDALLEALKSAIIALQAATLAMQSHQYITITAPPPAPTVVPNSQPWWGAPISPTICGGATSSDMTKYQVFSTTTPALPDKTVSYNCGAR
jgi:hypothetical protein